MTNNQILAADYLDILFDGKNKAYGAYYLRRTYDQRVMKALFIMFFLVGIFVLLVSLSGNKKTNSVPAISVLEIPLIVINEVEPEVETKEKVQPVKKEEVVAQQPAAAVNTTVFVEPTLVEEVETAPPTQQALENAIISGIKVEGPSGNEVTQPAALGSENGSDNTGTGESVSNEKFIPLEKQASFDGDWVKFLKKYLDANKAIDNGAPAGVYSVKVKFVVDIDGSVSELTAISNIGYGLEDEAIRVIKKSKKWIPAVQNNRFVKAQRIQTVTFIVNE